MIVDQTAINAGSGEKPKGNCTTTGNISFDRDRSASGGSYRGKVTPTGGDTLNHFSGSPMT